MATERMHFERDDQPYHAFEAAAHLARYGLARDLVQGRRVLDIACGEGYGALLLRRWGAAQVVAVDNAPEAIAVAKRRFADPAIEHICCDALDLPRHLGAEARFDLIVAFETIEHLPDPAAFLRMLAGLRAPGGVILVSCPNDAAAYGEAGDNPFHLARYDFDAFRRMSEAAIGPVTHWMIETPAVGVVQLAAMQRDAPSADPAITRGRPLGALLLPAQGGEAPGVADCLAYVAVWGATPADATVLAPTTLSAFLAPWRWREATERRLAGLAAQATAQQADRRHLLRQAEQLDHAKAERDHANAERDHANAERDHAEAERDHARSRMQECDAALHAARRALAETEAALGHERRLLAVMRASTSWRFTAPLRALARRLGLARFR